MFRRIFKWLISTVLASVIPLLITGIILNDHEKLKVMNDLWPRGELFLISLIGTATALGDLVVSAPKYVLAKTCITVGTVFFLMVTVCWYVELTSDSLLIGGGAGNGLRDKILSYSPYVFVFSLIVGVACVMLPPGDLILPAEEKLDSDTP